MMSELDVQVVTVHGHTNPELRAYASRKIGQLARLAPRPVLLARVTLDRAPDPAVDRPALARATLDVSGRIVRAAVAAGRFNEAVDLLEARLRSRLEHLTGHRRARRHSKAAPRAASGRTAAASRAPAGAARGPEERAVVRHSQLAPAPMPVVEAALDMNLLGDEFYLFVEAGTGHDAVVSRLPDGALALAVAGGGQPDLTGCAAPVRSLPAPPRLTLGEATRRLELTGEPFVFFVDAGSGRGAVAYRRGDGDDGLIASG